MAHGTRINGVNKAVTAGFTRINGVNKKITKGLTLVDGVQRDIPLGGKKVTLTITGTTSKAQVVIAGTTYTSPATVEVEVGEEIVFRFQVTYTFKMGYVEIDGVRLFSATTIGWHECKYTVETNMTINMYESSFVGYIKATTT